MNLYFKNIKLVSLAFTAVSGMVLTSCSNDIEPSGSQSPYVDGLEISMATRAVEDGREFGIGPQSGLDLDELIPFSLKFDANTTIQVSQQTTRTAPFQTDDAIYDFKYKTESNASWSDEATYNFTPYNQESPLEWNKIGEGGSFSGGFALYSLYFPVDNKIQERIEGNTHIYTVKKDQSTLENLKASDIMGAYHSTPSIFSRIRFRMFHLMTYLRIRLYVPVFKEDKNTGYREGALLSATLDNVNPEFSFDWSIIPSGDTEGPSVLKSSGNDEIKMYQHPLADGKTEHEKVLIEYKKFLKDGYFDQGIDGDFDEVRVYDFSVIFPAQKGSAEDGIGNPFTATEFLNFIFRTNSGAQTRYYFEQSLVGQTTDVGESNELHLNQGDFQYLELYVPRVGNKLIYVSANVNPWVQRATDMMLQQQPEGN